MIKVDLTTERLYLNNIREEDCNQTYLSWLMDMEVNKYMESRFYSHSIESIKNFVKEQSEHAVYAAIRIKVTNKHIGNIKIGRLNKNHKTGEYGIMMGDRLEWGKGYAKEASIAIINHCFSEVGLNKVLLGVIDNNTVAYQLYLKLGFVVEGVLKENFYDPDEKSYRDEIRMAVFKKDWKYQ